MNKVQGLVRIPESDVIVCRPDIAVLMVRVEFDGLLKGAIGCGQILVYFIKHGLAVMGQCHIESVFRGPGDAGGLFRSGGAAH